MESHVFWQHVCTKSHKWLVLTKILKTELKVVNNYSQALPPQPCLPDLIHTVAADWVLHHPSTRLQQCKYLKQTRIGAVGPRGWRAVKTCVTGQLLPLFHCTDTAEKGSSACRMQSTSPVCLCPSPTTGNTYILLDYFLAFLPLP